MPKDLDLPRKVRENIRGYVARGPAQASSDPRDPKTIKVVHRDGRIVTSKAKGQLAPGYETSPRKK